MDSKERRSSAAPPLLVLVVLVALLPLLYVAAIGPIAWLGQQGLVNVDDNSIAMKAYLPVAALANRSETVEKTLAWYVSFWIATEPPPQRLHGY